MNSYERVSSICPFSPPLPPPPLRWPRTLAGITSYQFCLQLPYPSVSMSGDLEQKKASRYCDRSGRWEEGDYSHCLYINDITRVLYNFILVRSHGVIT